MNTKVSCVYEECDAPPEGAHEGTCRGSLVQFQAGNRKYLASIDPAIKSISEPCTVVVKNKKVSVKFK